MARCSGTLVPRPAGGTPEPQTAHFSLWEVSAPRYKMRGGRYVRNAEGYAVRDRAQPARKAPARYWPAIGRLFAALETIRAAYGRGLRITPAGGWRDAHTNGARRKVSKRSQHLRGTAADIKGGRKLYELIKKLRAQGAIPAGGLSLYRGFVHYDIRGERTGKNVGW